MYFLKIGTVYNKSLAEKEGRLDLKGSTGRQAKKGDTVSYKKNNKIRL